MNAFDLELAQRLDKLRGCGLYRELRRIDSPQGRQLLIQGRTFLNFSSNDYLGLANEPALKLAGIRAVERFGAGAGASRLISGSLAPHHELEEGLAAFKGTAAALTFSTGYATALGVIGALLDKNDLIIIDRLAHASIVDAARLCGANLRVFRHNDLNDLERILKWADGRFQSVMSELPGPVPGGVQTPGNEPLRPQVGQRRGRVLIVTESIFSMDGDQAPLRELVELKEKYGAWLMVDEAHATGLYGARQRGLAEELGVSDRIEVQMGTLGKALGASGGYICGSRTLIDYLVNRARSFIFSTAPVPAAAAAALAGVRLVQSADGQERCRHLWALTSMFAGVPNHHSAIMPILIGAEAEAVALASRLRERGIFVPAIRYPTVARGAARLRVTITALHTPEDIQTLLAVLGESQDQIQVKTESP